MIRKCLIAISCFLITSCATFSEPVYFYNEIVIMNKSREVIQDVTISAGETGRRFSCGNIAPLGICSNKTPPRQYMKNPITLAWVFGSTARQIDDFILEVPISMTTEFPLRGVLEISPRGSVSAYFQQDIPAN